MTRPISFDSSILSWVQQVSGENNISGIAPNIYNGRTAGSSLFPLSCLGQITRLLEIVRSKMDKKEETLRILGSAVEMIN